MSSTSLTIRIPNDLYQWIETEAEESHRSRSAQISYCIDITQRFNDIRHRLELAAAGSPLMTISEFLSDLDQEIPDPDFQPQTETQE
jgi:predicted transcriptional regulator